MSSATDASENEAQCFLEVENIQQTAELRSRKGGAGHHGTEKTGRAVMTSQGAGTRQTRHRQQLRTEQHQATAERSSARAKRRLLPELSPQLADISELFHVRGSFTLTLRKSANVEP